MNVLAIISPIKFPVLLISNLFLLRVNFIAFGLFLAISLAKLFSHIYGSSAISDAHVKHPRRDFPILHKLLSKFTKKICHLKNQIFRILPILSNVPSPRLVERCVADG